MSTELKTISSRAITKLKMEETQPRLTRATSLEKIKKFNTFICSQQFYILPTLLNWLKISQSNLHVSAESTTYFLRAFILNVFFKFYSTFFKKQQQFGVAKIQTIVGRSAALFLKRFSKCLEPTVLLSAGVYAACCLVVVQFLFTIYLIYLLILPQGFLFLVGCMLTIQYICYKTTFKFVSEPGKEQKKFK